uniref:CCDC113/CCDC96 coiled-coil domain-containing protein n=1 Tax=Oryzias latipes TaxID=8090 RepID=A0A3P9MAK1_ORYLA
MKRFPPWFRGFGLPGERLTCQSVLLLSKKKLHLSVKFRLLPSNCSDTKFINLSTKPGGVYEEKSSKQMMSVMMYPVSEAVLLDGIEQRLLFPAGPSSLRFGTPDRKAPAVDLLVAVPPPVVTDLCSRREALRAQVDIGALGAPEPQVETEQQELEALWRSAVAALSPHLGEEAARARVEASLRAEKLAQDSLSQVRLKHFKLTLRIRRLEAELREEEEFNREVLEVKNQQLEAERRQKELTERKAAEIKQLINENIRVSQVLPKVKEKLCQIQVEVQNKRQQLAEVEAVVMEKKDLLTRTKQACHRLQRDNLRLQERRGLLGNRVLLQDFEDTVDAADELENRLETLELQHADMISCCHKLRNLME